MTGADHETIGRSAAAPGAVPSRQRAGSGRRPRPGRGPARRRSRAASRAGPDRSRCCGRASAGRGRARPAGSRRDDAPGQRGRTARPSGRSGILGDGACRFHHNRRSRAWMNSGPLAPARPEVDRGPPPRGAASPAISGRRPPFARRRPGFFRPRGRVKGRAAPRRVARDARASRFVAWSRPSSRSCRSHLIESVNVHANAFRPRRPMLASLLLLSAPIAPARGAEPSAAEAFEAEARMEAENRFLEAEAARLEREAEALRAGRRPGRGGSPRRCPSRPTRSPRSSPKTWPSGRPTCADLGFRRREVEELRRHWLDARAAIEFQRGRLEASAPAGAGRLFWAAVALPPLVLAAIAWFDAAALSPSVVEDGDCPVRRSRADRRGRPGGPRGDRRADPLLDVR